MSRQTIRHPLFLGLAVATLSFLTLAGEAHSTQLITLYQFTGGVDGGFPSGGVVQDRAGILYGTTATGGNPSCGCGTVYSFSRAAGLKTLISFAGTNGNGPESTLLLNGTTLYGNTGGGGTSNDGVIFSVHTDGSGFTLLHQFSGTDGRYPIGMPRLGADGTLYGITAGGGSGNDGVLFSIKPDGAYTILHIFTDGADGGDPASLLMSDNGDLVGSTAVGGVDSACDPPYGCGVIFRYRPNTGAYTVMATFKTNAGPLLGSVGPGPTIYGNIATYYNDEQGNEVFSLDPSGFHVVTLIQVQVYKTGESYPGPTLAPDGSLLLTVGPSVYGGGGNLLRIQNGKITGDVYFNNSNGGTYGPSGQPIVGKSGNVFGTTEYAGLCDYCGTIYEVTP